MEWKTEKRKVSDLKPWSKNPRQMTDENFENLLNQIKEVGFNVPVIINRDNTIVAGHQRVRAMKELGYQDEEIPVRVPERMLKEREFERLALGDNRFKGEFDNKLLVENFDPDMLLGEMKFEEWEFGEYADQLTGSTQPKVDSIDLDNVPEGEEEQPQEGGQEQDQPGEQQAPKEEENENNVVLPFETVLLKDTRTKLKGIVNEIKANKETQSEDVIAEILIKLFRNATTDPELKENIKNYLSNED